jgi:hypothetical protein
MKADIKIMGVPVLYEIPANLAELLALPGCTEELVYKLCLKQVLYHGSYGGIRDQVSKLAEERGLGKRLSYFGKKLVTQEEVEVEGKKTKVWKLENGKPLTDDQADTVETETDAIFFRRLCAELGVEPPHFTSLVQDAADKVPFDVTRKERTAADKKANKAHLKIAESIFEANAMDRVAKELSDALERDVDVSGDREESINKLALAIGENEKREAALRANKYLTMGA